MEMGKGEKEMTEDFQKKIREAVEKHFDEFDDGTLLKEMENVLHRAIACESMRRNRKAKLSARMMGVSYHKFRKILGRE